MARFSSSETSCDSLRNAVRFFTLAFLSSSLLSLTSSPVLLATAAPAAPNPADGMTALLKSMGSVFKVTNPFGLDDIGDGGTGEGEEESENSIDVGESSTTTIAAPSADDIDFLAGGDNKKSSKQRQPSLFPLPTNAIFPIDWDLVNRIGAGIMRAAVPAVVGELIPQVVPNLIRQGVEWLRQMRYNVLSTMRIDPSTAPLSFLDTMDVEGVVKSGVNVARAAFTGAVQAAAPPPPPKVAEAPNPLAALLNPEGMGGVVSSLVSNVISQSISRLAGGGAPAGAAAGGNNPADALSGIMKFVGGMLAQQAAG